MSEIRGEDKSKSNEELATNHSNLSAKSTTSSLQLELVGSRVCQVIVPVLFCALYVTLLTRILDWNIYKSSFISTAWSRIGVTPDDNEQVFTRTLINNIIIVTVFVILIILMTLMMLFIFYMGWHSCLSYYFYVPSLLIMALITPIVIANVLLALNITLDYITMIIVLWNFTAFGMISIFNLFMRAPLFAQQFYLIHNSGVLAVLIIRILPGWAPWLLLVFLVFWDLFAVLAPIGPLNLLIDLAEREGVIDMPGLIYATDPTLQQPSTLELPDRSIEDSTSDRNSTKRRETDRSKMKNATAHQRKLDDRDKTQVQKKQTSGSIDDVEKEKKKRKSIQEKGVNMGLGDFIFYSILIGLTVKGREKQDFYATIAALDGVVVGLVLTLGILAATRRALPALPISIALGLISAGTTYYSIPNIFNKFAVEQVFI